MKKLLERLWGGQEGLTLVELLVVLSILGVMMAIIVPAVGGNTTLGRERSLPQDKQIIQQAADSYYSDTSKFLIAATRQKYPIYGGGLQASASPIGAVLTQVITTSYMDFGALIANGFMTKAPLSAGYRNNIASTVNTVQASPATPTTAGTGTYSWFITQDGLVHYVGTFQGADYPVDTYASTYP